MKKSHRFIIVSILMASTILTDVAKSQPEESVHLEDGKSKQKISNYEAPNQSLKQTGVSSVGQQVNGKKSQADDTIIVTGSHIRGANTSIGNQLISIGQEEIKKSGYSTVRDIFEALPQNFGGGATGETQANVDSLSNSGFGSTINLRGIGSVATLVLVNGRRLPAGGLNNSAVDVSILPLNAIERVEILPDGASAVYGADAVAGVVNFILRRDYSGLESRARYGTVTRGKLDEYQFNQAAGVNWNNGNAFLSYEFYHKDRLRRQDLEFAKTSDFRSKGGKDLRLPFGNPGIILDPATLEALFAIPSGQDGTSLTAEQLLPPENANYVDLSKYEDIFPRQTRHSIYGSAYQDLNSNIQIFSELRYSRRKFSNRSGANVALLLVPPNNPYYFDLFETGEPLFVGYSFHKDAESPRTTGHVESYGGVFGATISHPNGWQTDAFASLNRDISVNRPGNLINYNELDRAILETNPNLAFNPFVDGPQANPDIIDRIITDVVRIKVKSRINQGQIVTSGTMFHVNSLPFNAAAGLDYRNEKFFRNYTGTNSGVNAKLKREVWAAFGEIHAPFIEPEMNINGFARLELSASIRHERYKDKSIIPEEKERDTQSSTNPRIGIVWSPLESVSARGSYGTSFRAPGLYTLAALNSVSATQIPDPSSPTGRTYALLVSGSKPDLGNEKAKTWTIGIDFSNPEITSFFLKTTYFKIRFKDQVATPFSFTALADPALASIITRNPTLEEIQNACSLAPVDRRQVGSQDCTTPGVVQVIIDGRADNFSRTTVAGFDFQLGHSLSLGQFGTFMPQISATYLTRYKTAFSPAARSTSRLDTAHYPLDFRSRISLIWAPSAVSIVNLFINYADDYKDPVNNRRISSHTTLDLTLSHEFKGINGASILNDMTFQLGITNITDNSPPFYENSGTLIGYDPENADPLGRFIYISLMKRW